MATVQPMDLAPPAPEPPPLATAFLALSGSLEAAPPPSRFRLVVALAAVATSAVLALSGPVAWISRPTVRPSDLPPATQPSKASVPAPDVDAGDG